MRNRIFCFLTFLVYITACNPGPENSGVQTPVLSAENLARHIQTLASDSFLGRMPSTEGESITIDYLQRQFEAAGLEPGNGNGYLQEVPMASILALADPLMQVKAGSGNFNLQAYDEYVIWTDKTDPQIVLQDAELVFAGYGVVAPEHNWNDYANIDVKGKVVLVMVNDPGFWTGDTSLFKGREMTYYGRWTYKFEEAARQGAKACLIIHNTEAASYPFIVQQNGFNTARLQLDNRGKKTEHADAIGWISEPAANKLFKAAGMDSTLLQKANVPGFKAVPLNMTVSTRMNVQVNYSRSHNVVGKITGSTRPEETIIYTAHWDHFGIGTPDESGDSIYNGTMDNATGTAALIELARAFKQDNPKPERTIVFLAVTAEEQGLWGSAYYTQNPIFAPEKTVANINIDVLNPFEATRDIITIGKGQSELEDYLKEIAEKHGREMAYETTPEAGYYYRSDHFNFAKIGIPALYTKRGVKVDGKESDYGKKQEQEYTSQHYHRPSDEYDPRTWTLEGAMADLQIMYEIGKKLAAEDKMVQWKPGSEFKKLREK